MTNLDFAIDGPTWPMHEHSQFVRAAGMQWHVQIFGQGPTALLLHGTGASTHSWRHLAPFLQSHFRLVMLDLPGHGFTETPDHPIFTLPGMAGAVAALVDHLKVQPHLAIGHSAGAAVLVQMALSRHLREARLVSINGALLPFQGVAGHIFSPLAKLMFLNPIMPQIFAWRAGSQGVVDRLLRGTGSNLPDDDVRLYQRLFASPKHCAAALEMMARWDLHGFEQHLSGCQRPLHLIAAEGDTAISPADAERVAARVQGSTVSRIVGAGHLVHEERPKAVAELILSLPSPTPHARHP